MEEGLIVKMSNQEARKKYGNRLTIASLGATPKDSKDKLGGDTVVRVLYDGTHGVLTNHRIRVRDRQRFPAVDDLETAWRISGSRKDG